MFGAAGVIRLAGIAGHRDPDVLLRGIRGSPIDRLLLSLNAANTQNRPSQGEPPAEAFGRGMGIMGMKVTVTGRPFRQGGTTSMEQALKYTLSFPASAAIIGNSSIGGITENLEKTGIRCRGRVWQ